MAVLAVTAVVYGVVTYVLAELVSYLDMNTTGPMSTAAAWGLVSVVLIPLPAGVYVIAEGVWWERAQRARRTLDGGGAAPAPAGHEQPATRNP